MAAKKKMDEPVVEVVVEPIVEPIVEPVVEAGFYVAEGCSVTSRKGIVSRETGALKAEWFHGGEATLSALVEAGHVVKIAG